MWRPLDTKFFLPPTLFTDTNWLPDSYMYISVVQCRYKWNITCIFMYSLHTSRNTDTKYNIWWRDLLYIIVFDLVLFLFLSDKGKRYCEWHPIDFATDEPIRRGFRAVFSSVPAAEDFYKSFQQVGHSSCLIHIKLAICWVFSKEWKCTHFTVHQLELSKSLLWQCTINRQHVIKIFDFLHNGRVKYCRYIVKVEEYVENLIMQW